MKRIILITVFAIVIQALTISPTFANTNGDKSEKIKAGIAKLGIGPEAKVKVTLKDKSNLEGYVVSSNDEQFVVMDSASNQAVPVSYPQVKKVKGNNLNTGVKIAIGVGIVLVVMVLLLSQVKT